MAQPLPPDPYKALGLTKDADASTIKSTYRKLVLKCHPDKVTDVSLKPQKQEEFHKIQQAYELIGDEEKRSRYDAEVRLDFLRREKANRSGPSVDVKTARYEVRTAAPSGASFSTSAPSRYEERDRKSARSSDEDRYDERARTYDAYPSKTSSSRTSRPDKEPPIRVRVSADRTRSDHKKTRDREERRDRSNKHAHVDDDLSSNDEKRAAYEAAFRRRSEEARRKDEEELRRAAEARRKLEADRRAYEESRYPDRQRKLNDLENEAMRHISRTKTSMDPRPAPTRTVSSRDIRPVDAYERSSRRDRPEPVRRSSARPKEQHPSSSTGRDRERNPFPEIVEWDEDERQMPSFKHSTSSPADISVPPIRVTPQRAYTEAPPREHRRTESSPSPIFRRSETMPPHSSSRRKEVPIARPSTIRSSEMPPREPSSRSPETKYPTIPTQSSSTTYYYPSAPAGPQLDRHDTDVASGHRTVLHEPSRHRARSPSPLARPPMGPNRPSETSSAQYQSTPKLAVPTLGRSATFNVSPRGDDRPRVRPGLFREISGGENARRQHSFGPETIAYAKKIGPEDVSWSSSRREPMERGREYAKPTLQRHPTSVY